MVILDDFRQGIKLAPANAKPFSGFAPGPCRTIFMLCLETGEYLCLNVAYRPSLGEYMNTNLIVAIAASGLLLAGAASAQKNKIKPSDLPPALDTPMPPH